jgi:N-acyl-D-aspartate/D-glutamate deacylase
MLDQVIALKKDSATALLWTLAAVAPLGLSAAPADPYDIVLRGGRVMDPETGRDQVADVGISGGTVARISATPLQGARVIDAHGLVVAPGFVDLHSHAQDPEGYRLKVLDGVTTALEMELGVADVGRFLDERNGGALVNFGTTADHPAARAAALGSPQPEGALVPPSGPATDRPATEEEIERIKARLRSELDKGALGIGMGLAYTPGATRHEVIETFRLAAQWRRPVFTHVRSSGRTEPGSSIESVEEVIGAAAVTGAALHIVHINSSCLRDAPECLALVEGARARGLDVTTEAYPYGAGMTAINSSLFLPGWEQRLGIGYGELEDPETGRRLDEAAFRRLRGAPTQKLVLLFVNPDEVVDAVMVHPLVMVASDGLLAHPRGAGTYARVLARYVRTQGRLSLMDALRKMALMPAQRLERATAAARRKGRLQEDADADITVFDPRTVEDRATYKSPRTPSVGVRYVLVAGTPVVWEGSVVEGVRPGRALRADVR